MDKERQIALEALDLVYTLVEVFEDDGPETCKEMEEAADKLKQRLEACGRQGFCVVHKRKATHVNDKGELVCDPSLGGITMPCKVYECPFGYPVGGDCETCERRKTAEKHLKMIHELEEHQKRDVSKSILKFGRCCEKETESKTAETEEAP